MANRSRTTKRIPDPDAAYYIAMFESGAVVAGVMFDEASESPVVLGLSREEVRTAAVVALRSNGNDNEGKTVVLAEVRDVQRFKLTVVPSRVELEPVDA